MRNLKSHYEDRLFDSNELKLTKVVVRRLEVDDLDAVVRIHMAAFPKSALTLLGAGAVRRYYTWQLLGPHDVTASGAFIGSNLVGYSFSGVFQGATSGFLKKNRWYLMIRVLSHPWLISNPLIRERLRLGARILGSKKRAGKPAVDKRRSFGILSIAVDPSVQGSGVGQMLMRNAETTARTLGFNQMHLTVNPENDQAVRFYEKLNWKKSPTVDGWTGSMRKALGS